MNLSLFIARRTALTRRRTDGRRASRSPAVGVAVSAVALSLAVMLCAVAVVEGFKQQITGKIAGFNAHLQLYRVMDGDAQADADNIITLTPALRGIIADEPYVEDVEMELTVPAVLKTDSDFKGIYVKSSDGESMRRFIATQVTEGRLPGFTGDSASAEIAISRNMASDLGLDLGDSIPTFYLHNDLVARRYKVAAIYATHFENYDDLIALGNINELRAITGIGKGQGVTMRIMTDDFRRVEEYGTLLQQCLDEAYLNGEIFVKYRVEPVTARSASYFAWLQLLDTNVAVILSLMTLVACITLIAAMLILIIDKVRLIGILRSLGARRSMVRRIFIFMALRIAAYGLVVGNAAGIVLLWAQQRWHMIPLDADNYYIDFVPVQLNWQSVLVLNAGVAAVVFLSLLLPSMLAGRISPAESMRYQD